MILKSLLGVLATLAQAFAIVREPRTTLFDHAMVGGEIQQVALARNPFPVHDVELGLAERRCDFVLRDFHFSAIADDAVAVFDRADAANIEPQRGIKLQRATAGRSLGITEHYADLFANLIDEDEASVRLGHDLG